MALPRFIRHWMAAFLGARSPAELGGLLYDYNNGDLKQLSMWDDEKSQEATLAIVENMMNAGRDAVYFVVVKIDEGKGYFVVHDSERNWWFRWFWRGIYEPKDALRDALDKCRETANKMGFRERDDAE